MTDSFEQRNSALCRKDLDFVSPNNHEVFSFDPSPTISWIRILGVSAFWEHDVSLTLLDLSQSLIASLDKHGIVFCQLLTGSSKGIELYLGISSEAAASVEQSLVSLFPGISTERHAGSPLVNADINCGGLVVGDPSWEQDHDGPLMQIESVIRGMLGRDFTLLTIGKSLGPMAATLATNSILSDLEEVSSSLKQTVFGGAQGNITAEHVDYRANEYLRNLTTVYEVLQDSLACGLWQVCTYYGAATEVEARMLGNMIRSAFADRGSQPEPIRVVHNIDVASAMCNCGMPNQQSPVKDLHPLGSIRLNNGNEIGLFSNRYTTVLSSRQFAVFTQLPSKEFPGFFVDDYVEFDTARRETKVDGSAIPIGKIQLPGRGNSPETDNDYLFPVHDFSRHALVIGVTGGGKTNTSKSLLAKLWCTNDNTTRIPFLVIESAKREYWELRSVKGFEDLQVFTLGDEAMATSVRYRINPFETIQGISLQTHIDYLLSTFKAAFELYPPMPYALETAVYEVYEDAGWDIVENVNVFGLTEYPTLEDLYNKIDVVVNRLGYDVEVQSNVKAALKARIGSLMIGGKGAMLDTKKSVPIQQLLKSPVVMELEDLGDDETKSFVIGILLVQLYEYRKATMKDIRQDFSHLLLIEEAHRLLKNVPKTSGEGSNTQAKSVEFFCNLLAEIRTFGQGIMIADQIPTKLAPDTIKNTNLKIAHRTVAFDDREVIGRSMHMTQEQIEYLASLPRGCAAVYAEGDNRPKYVRFPLVEAYYPKQRKDVIREMQKKAFRLTNGFEKFDRKHVGCAFCEQRCEHFSRIKHVVDEWVIRPSVIFDIWRARGYSAVELCKVINQALDRGIVSDKGIHQEICYLGYLLSKHEALSAGEQQVLLARFLHKRLAVDGKEM